MAACRSLVTFVSIVLCSSVAHAHKTAGSTAKNKGHDMAIVVGSSAMVEMDEGLEASLLENVSEREHEQHSNQTAEVESHRSSWMLKRHGGKFIMAVESRSLLQAHANKSTDSAVTDAALFLPKQCSDFSQLPPSDPMVQKWKGLLPHEASHIGVWRSPTFDSLWQAVAENTPPNTPAGTTFQSAIAAICAGEGPDCTVALHGGAVRDLFHGKTPKDIDLVWNLATPKVLDKMTKIGFTVKAELAFEYLIFGKVEDGNEFEPLEGNGWNSVVRPTPCSGENNVNSLMYDPVARVIIDEKGTGVTDNCQMLFRLPQACTDVADWLQNGAKIGFRAFKMIQKGYNWANPLRDKRFLLETFSAQHEKLGDEKFTKLYQNFIGAMNSNAPVIDRELRKYFKEGGAVGAKLESLMVRI